MTLFQQIQEDLRNAIKSNDNIAKDSLRFLISEIKKQVLDNGYDRENIPDKIVLSVLEKSIKSRKESISIFEKQGRNDLATEEKKQLEIIFKYLPAQLSDEELKAIIKKVSEENPTIKGIALMGKVMPFLKGKADPEKVKSLILSLDLSDV